MMALKATHAFFFLKATHALYSTPLLCEGFTSPRTMIPLFHSFTSNELSQPAAHTV